MLQLGNTYTGKFSDIPTYLTVNHLYYAYDTKELYTFNSDHTPYLLAPRSGDNEHIEESKIVKVEIPKNELTSIDRTGVLMWLNINGVVVNGGEIIAVTIVDNQVVTSCLIRITSPYNHQVFTEGGDMIITLNIIC